MTIDLSMKVIMFEQHNESVEHKRKTTNDNKYENESDFPTKKPTK